MGTLNAPSRRADQQQTRRGGGDSGAPWRDLTRRLVLAKAARGELPPAVLEALLDHAGVAP